MTLLRAKVLTLPVFVTSNRDCCGNGVTAITDCTVIESGLLGLGLVGGNGVTAIVIVTVTFAIPPTVNVPIRSPYGNDHSETRNFSWPNGNAGSNACIVSYPYMAIRHIMVTLALILTLMAVTPMFSAGSEWSQWDADQRLMQLGSANSGNITQIRAYRAGECAMVHSKRIPGR